jgi:hypothetical protein
MSTRRSMISPNRIAPMPSNVALFSPGPVPVNARDPDGAVTIWLAGAAVPLEPDAFGGSVLAVTAGAAVDVVAEDVVAVVGVVVVLVDDDAACDVDVVDPGVVVVDAGASVVVGDGGSVVVGDGGSVVVVTDGVLVGVVVDVPPPLAAITGSMGAAVGVEVVMPEGVTASLG